MNNCIIRIQELLSSLPKQTAKVANYVLKHPEEASQLTIVELAKKTQSSTATVVRFTNSLGYKGYRDFMKCLYQAAIMTSGEEEDNYYELAGETNTFHTVKEMINYISRLNIEALISTAKIINPDCVEKAIDIMNKANRIYIYALSGSIVVAQDLEFKLDRLSISCRAYITPHSQKLSATTLKPNDVAIFISYSGETKEIVSTAEIARDQKAKTISITKYGDNPLNKVCQINLKHSSLGQGFRSFSTRSRIVQQNVIDILFVALANRRGEHLQKYYDLFNYTPHT